MAKRKTKKPVRKTRKTSRKTKSPRLGYYLLAGLITVFVMWLLIREPESAPQDLERIAEDTKKEQTESPKKPTVRTKKDKDKSAEEEIEITIAPVREKKEEAVVIVDGETEPDRIIREAANDIGVPPKALGRRTGDGRISFSIPIDSAQMDLTYANMIFKGKMERGGARLIKGQDTKSRQSLLFEHNSFPDQYEINLYYDSKIYQRQTSQKTITIVVDDFGGISGKLLEGFFSVDPEVCFAIFPEERHSDQTMRLAKRQGRDTIIHVPMEPIGYPRVNPGKNAILVQHSETQVRKLLTGFINKMPDCIGINNHMGSLATSDEQLMQWVSKVLKEQDKLFLDSRTTNVSVAYKTAQKAGIRTFQNDIFLDNPNITTITMDNKLEQINRMAGKNKHVIAITHCHDQAKLDYLKEFIRRLKNAGFTLVPLSEIDQRNIPEIL